PPKWRTRHPTRRRGSRGEADTRAYPAEEKCRPTLSACSVLAGAGVEDPQRRAARVPRFAPRLPGEDRHRGLPQGRPACEAGRAPADAPPGAAAAVAVGVEAPLPPAAELQPAAVQPELPQPVAQLVGVGARTVAEAVGLHQRLHDLLVQQQVLGAA